jgi:ATP-dependent helicase/DNAse subunit B
MQEPFQLPTYLDMIKESPKRAIKEILTCAFIMALMAGALYFKEILWWIEGVAR